jgi:hypothetical protein
MIRLGHATSFRRSPTIAALLLRPLLRGNTLYEILRVVPIHADVVEKKERQILVRVTPMRRATSVLTLNGRPFTTGMATASATGHAISRRAFFMLISIQQA